MAPPTLESVAALHDLALEAQDASPATRKLYGHVLALYRAWVSGPLGRPATVAQLTPEQVRRWAGWLVETSRSAATSRHYQRILKTHSRWLAAEEVLPDDPLARLVLPRLKRREPKIARDDELARMVAACSGTLQPHRNKAILLLLADSAIRVSGLCRLDLADVDWPGPKQASGRVHIVLKGGDRSSFPFGSKTAVALRNYLALERGDREGDPNGPLFLTRERKRITVKAVERLVGVLADKAGIVDKTVTPHSLRHYAGTRMAEQGLNAWQLRDRLGHKSLDTSSLYIHLAQRDDNYRSALDDATEITPRLLKPPPKRSRATQ